MRLKFMTVSLAAVIVCLLIAPFVMTVSGQACGPNVTHVVAAGQTMYRIAIRYGTTVAAIAQANQIANPNIIYAGQTLVIPCAGTSPAPTAVPGRPTSTPRPTAFPNPFEVDGLTIAYPPVQINPAALVGGEIVPLTADCRNFRATSPTDGFANGENTLYWNPAPGATGFRINIYNHDRFFGRLVGTYQVGPIFTNFRTNLGEGYIGPGMVYSWEVQALISDQVVCTTPRVRLLRSSTPS